MRFTVKFQTIHLKQKGLSMLADALTLEAPCDIVPAVSEILHMLRPNTLQEVA